ncbi:hypothetical protein SAMN04488117_11878 [Celeribacter baekdonensis]|uniref:RHS repeat-associated core domain-containing protein n=1 Tax=Celeribacter baekdonensis TaxID=875171 RepID=A0A1G7TU90_9RHOB|nr:hypothetical protein [Celeribacter baekdonensis]SDG38926.1 hypothetical protein SAMN04488117_11878 [Celeribacter baekdonensis]
MTIFRILKQLFLATLIAIFATQSSAMFIQPDWLDPTQPGVGLNRVAYSANDPVNLSDPNGNLTVAVKGTNTPDDDPRYQEGSEFLDTISETFGEAPVVLDGELKKQRCFSASYGCGVGELDFAA